MTSYRIIYSDHLAHHGILGQKWGKRNGPPYPLGASDHSSSEKKAGWRNSLKAASYKVVQTTNKAVQTTKKGAKAVGDAWVSAQAEEYKKKYNLSTREANAEARKKAKAMKKAALIIGGVALASVVAYGAYTYGRDYADQIIKAGTTIQTLSHDPDRLLKGEQFYTNFKTADKKIYEGMFGAGWGEYKHAITATVNENLKIASDKSGEKAFKYMLENDPRFRRTLFDRFTSSQYVKELLSSYGYSGNKPDEVSKLSGKALHKVWHAYNRSVLPLDSEESLYGRTSFYAELAKRGYSGLIDINDTRYSNLRGISPTIMFDKSHIGNISSRKLNGSDIVKGQLWAKAIVPALHLVTDEPSMASVGSAAVTGLSVWGYVSYGYDAGVHMKYRNNKTSGNTNNRSENSANTRKKKPIYDFRKGRIVYV